MIHPMSGMIQWTQFHKQKQKNFDVKFSKIEKKEL